MLSQSILKQLAVEHDGFEGGATSDLLDLYGASIGQIVELALYRALSAIEDCRFTRTEINSISSTGITLNCVVEHMARCCHVGTSSQNIALTWDELLNESPRAATLVRERYDVAEAVDRAAKESKYQKEREAEERAQLAQLQAKYKA